MSEGIGRHKGNVETLLHEKKELSRLLNIVNSQLERHLKALEEEGVDTDSFIQELHDRQQGSNSKQSQGKTRGQKDDPLDDSQEQDHRDTGNIREEGNHKENSKDRDFNPL